MSKFEENLKNCNLLETGYYVHFSQRKSTYFPAYLYMQIIRPKITLEGLIGLQDCYYTSDSSFYAVFKRFLVYPICIEAVMKCGKPCVQGCKELSSKELSS